MPDDSDHPFASNKTFGAHARDAEWELVRAGIQPVDLRTIPRERWDDFLNFQLTPPPSITEFLNGHDGTPLSAETVRGMEQIVEQHQGITEPYTVTMDLRLQQTGRAWAHVPEAAKLLTGFILDKLEA